ncbi:hypothetical protein F5X68DRAFT_227083 [Plectosphaerella plurivora]|uniref:Uncharacterized protein n=1 Tax=Plectosphaerella plurivora TaxID=936078 RepID=A0A9P9AC81_9PEZI|nr:hypothetical protein F5X68DRAFT_227083 [Plectosphaerella plurivora]
MLIYHLPIVTSLHPHHHNHQDHQPKQQEQSGLPPSTKATGTATTTTAAMELCDGAPVYPEPGTPTVHPPSWLEINTPYGPLRTPWLPHYPPLHPWHHALLERIAQLPSSLIEIIISQTFLKHGCAIRNFDPYYCRHAVNGCISRGIRESDGQHIEVYTKGDKGQRGTYHSLAHQISYPAKLFKYREEWFGTKEPDPEEVWEEEWFNRKKAGIMALRALWPMEWDLARLRARQEGMHTFDEARFSMPTEAVMEMVWDTPEILEHANTINGYKTNRTLPFTNGMHWSCAELIQEPRIYLFGDKWRNAYEDIRHLTLGTTLRPGTAGWKPTLDEQVERQVFHELDPYAQQLWVMRASKDQMQWLHLDWSRLSKLETLVMDLSGYHNVFRRFRGNWKRTMKAMNVDKAHFKKTGRVRFRGMECLNLSLLVVKGLKSGKIMYPKEEDDSAFNNRRTIQEIEDDITLKHGDGEMANWVEIFRHCLADGGKLVLLDHKDLGGHWNMMHRGWSEEYEILTWTAWD